MQTNLPVDTEKWIQRFVSSGWNARLLQFTANANTKLTFPVFGKGRRQTDDTWQAGGPDSCVGNLCDFTGVQATDPHSFLFCPAGRYFPDEGHEAQSLPFLHLLAEDFTHWQEKWGREQWPELFFSIKLAVLLTVVYRDVNFRGRTSNRN